jgi:Subtilase family/PKD domain/Calx-beta domain
MKLLKLASISVFSVFSALSAFGLDSDERTFFGLTSLGTTHPAINGEGYSVGVSDTEFDLTHPGLGWTGGADYNLWFYNRQHIPNLNRVNPRIFMAGHRMQTDSGYAIRHGASLSGFTMPITYNNTLMTNWWGFHGTAVAGTAAGGMPGPAGFSLGAAHKARLVLAGDTADMEHVLSMVPDGNPSRTVAMNRSFTGSSYVDSAGRVNAGVIGVNAAGNYFNLTSENRTDVFGNSPHLASVRWLEKVGFDLIASGLSLESATHGYAEAYGSQRNQESIFTDYTVRTLRPGGEYDAYASGTSFASPFLAGGVTLVQQAYESAHPGKWLRVDQMNRILKRSGKFIDDIYTGLRYPVANFAAAVALAEGYAGDPGYEPNFSTSFTPETRIENTSLVAAPFFLNPLYFRVSTAYGSNHFSEYTTAIASGGYMRVYGHAAGGNVNIALRNGWGDLACINLTEPGKNLNVAFNYDTSAGATSGNRTEFFIGIKEMVGSAQFMDMYRTHDNIDRGRLAFRISYDRDQPSARIDLLQYSEAPITTNAYFYEPIWQRPNYYTIPEWDVSSLATAFVTNLHNGSHPRIEVNVDKYRASLKINNQTIIDAAHTAPQIALTRSTPYLHFRNVGSNALQRLSAFAVKTISANTPVVSLESTRKRALEGVSGATADGIITIRRTSNTNQPLTVYYTVSGVAANGQDYEALPGSITIPAHVTSVDIQVKPLTDSLAEQSESVAISLAPNAAYIITPYHNEIGTVMIDDYTDIDSDGIRSADEDVNRNGNFSDDDANGNMLPNYLDFLDQVPTNNITPVANAGPAKSTIGINPVYLDGTQSADPDGNIAGIAWSIIPDINNGPVVLEDAASITPEIRWTAPSSSNRMILVRLTVTDNHGASASATTAVTQLAGNIFNKNYPQVYFRGTPNGWGTSGMSLITNNLWQIELVVSGGGTQSFKFDVYGDWSLNFGNNNGDGFADQSGGNIGISQGDGNYQIRFNDLTRAFSVTKVVPNVAPFVNAGPDVTTYQMNPVTLSGTNSYDADGQIVSYAWTIVEGLTGPIAITNINTATPTLQWHAPATSSRVAKVQLTVTDDDGASSSDTVTVTQVSTIVYGKTYPQVYFRGTANGWGTTVMTLVSNYTWETTMAVGSGTQNYKFDVNGDWSLNFGDNNNDGIAEQSGGNIGISQGAGTYIIRFNDQTRRYTATKLVVNQPPVANAGSNQIIYSLNSTTIYLDGGGSYDSDGSIVEYSWFQSGGPLAIITYAHPGQSGATVSLLTQPSNTTYTFSLRVTDNSGAMSTGTVTITQQAGGFSKIQPQIYLRGTPNNWGTTLMTLVSNYTWEIDAAFGSTSNERFKFDVHGDWSLNFGDNNSDGIAEQGGGNIIVAQGAGTYRVRFNDQTYAYTVTKLGGSYARDYTAVGVAGSFNGWNPAANNLQVIADYTWSGTFVLSGDVQLKFAANGNWGTNWGENNQSGTTAPVNGTLESSGGNIRLTGLAGATYRITMHERTRAYSVTLVTGSEAGPERTLVGWEARYGIDLLSDGTADADPDADELCNMIEYQLGTDPYLADSDSDHMSDLEEIIAATDPLNAACLLEVTPVLIDGNLSVTWPVNPNRLYRLEGTASLDEDSEWIILSDWINSHSFQGNMTASAAEGSTFYRVRVGQPTVIGISKE